MGRAGMSKAHERAGLWTKGLSQNLWGGSGPMDFGPPAPVPTEADATCIGESRKRGRRPKHPASRSFARGYKCRWVAGARDFRPRLPQAPTKADAASTGSDQQCRRWPKHLAPRSFARGSKSRWAEGDGGFSSPPAPRGRPQPMARASARIGNAEGGRSTCPRETWPEAIKAAGQPEARDFRPRLPPGPTKADAASIGADRQRRRWLRRPAPRGFARGSSTRPQSIDRYRLDHTQT